MKLKNASNDSDRKKKVFFLLPTITFERILVLCCLFDANEWNENKIGWHHFTVHFACGFSVHFFFFCITFSYIYDEYVRVLKLVLKIKLNYCCYFRCGMLASDWNKFVAIFWFDSHTYSPTDNRCLYSQSRDSTIFLVKPTHKKSTNKYNNNNFTHFWIYNCSIGKRQIKYINISGRQQPTATPARRKKKKIQNEIIIASKRHHHHRQRAINGHFYKTITFCGMCAEISGWFSAQTTTTTKSFNHWTPFLNARNSGQIEIEGNQRHHIWFIDSRRTS